MLSSASALSLLLKESKNEKLDIKYAKKNDDINLLINATNFGSDQVFLVSMSNNQSIDILKKKIFDIQCIPVAMQKLYIMDFKQTCITLTNNFDLSTLEYKATVYVTLDTAMTFDTKSLIDCSKMSIGDAWTHKRLNEMNAYYDESAFMELRKRISTNFFNAIMQSIEYVEALIIVSEKDDPNEQTLWPKATEMYLFYKQKQNVRGIMTIGLSLPYTEHSIVYHPLGSKCELKMEYIGLGHKHLLYNPYDGLTNNIILSNSPIFVNFMRLAHRWRMYRTEATKHICNNGPDNISIYAYTSSALLTLDAFTFKTETVSASASTSESTPLIKFYMNVSLQSDNVALGYISDANNNNNNNDLFVSFIYARMLPIDYHKTDMQTLTRTFINDKSFNCTLF